MKKDNKSKISRFSLLISMLLVAGVLLAAEPLFSTKNSFAVTYVEHPSIVENSSPSSDYLAEEPIKQAPHKTRAPEPSSMFLILSGITGMLVRFARKSYERFKRMADIILALVASVFALPVITVAALLIKMTSPGPFVYRQNRVGKDGKIFRIYKLRTMHVNAEKGTGAVWAKKNDPRITPIGKLLRKSHIDEIPQLINVLRGDMSIVGPRPERPELVRELKTLIVDYEKRLSVKPGITGLAQVWHKYDETLEDVKKKIKIDLLYIKKMCLAADLRIMAGTVVVMLTGKGAR